MRIMTRYPLYRGVSLFFASLFLYGVLVSSSSSAAVGQQAAPAVPGAMSGAVPSLISYGGVLKDAGGQIRTSVTGVTFLLYRDEQGGAPLWMETQNVTPDKTGRYTAQLGAATANGLPADLFQSGEPRWLAVQLAGEGEQPRAMLVAVPYAMKAADAQTLGGLPPSAFVLAASVLGGSTSGGVNLPASIAAPNGVSPSLSGSGTTDYLPLWSSSSALGSSILFQSGTGSSAKIGFNTTTPAATIDVNGGATIRGLLNLPPAGNATASAGVDSRPLGLVAQTYNSSSKATANQVFHWQAEPTGNNTASPSATLNLLYAIAPAAAVETGLRIASNGQITFASGQSFPGAGTITGVTAGTDLTGGGTSGAVTVNLDTTHVPQLNAANTFTGNQTVNGNLSATGVVTGSSYQIGSNLFAFGSFATANSFLGFAGNTTTTGRSNIAVGTAALQDITTGVNNTATGAFALPANTTGSGNNAYGSMALLTHGTGDANVAVGYSALFFNATGASNTAVGDFALEDNNSSSNTAVGYSSGNNDETGTNNTYLGYLSGIPAANVSLANATAIGANSLVSESNALILGGTAGNSVSVGIGTTAPFNDYGLTIDTTSSTTINGGMVVNASGGNLYLGMTQGVHKFRVDTNGAVWADGGFNSSGADFAESVAVRGRRSEYEPGDVLEIDRQAHRGLTLSRHSYATLVAGIYSTKPGVLASPHTIDDAVSKAGEIPLAIVGIVPCKVTTENGSIAPGDLLVTSSRAGFAMKGTDRRRMLGAVVGKALEPLPKGTGMIQVLVTLQ
jgi:hypothetical protein